MRGYPPWFTVKFINFFFAGMAITGFLLIPTTLNMRLDWEMGWRLESTHRILVAAIHLLFAFSFIAIIGAIASIHARLERQKKRNKKRGITIFISIALLSLTGIGIYYSGNETVALMTGMGHLILGLVLIVVYTTHVFFNEPK